MLCARAVTCTDHSWGCHLWLCAGETVLSGRSQHFPLIIACTVSFQHILAVTNRLAALREFTFDYRVNSLSDLARLTLCRVTVWHHGGKEEGDAGI